MRFLGALATYSIQHRVPAVGRELPVSLPEQNRVKLRGDQLFTGSFLFSDQVGDVTNSASANQKKL